MLTRKAKLLGVSALLLGTPSTISLSNSDLSDLSLNSLLFRSGGATSKRGDLDYGVSQNMEVGDLVKHIRDLKQKEITSPELMEVKGIIDLSKAEKVNDSNSGDTVKTTYSEITKEDKAIKLDTDSTGKARDYQERSKKHLQEYLSGKEKIERFAQSHQQSQLNRVRRSVKKNIPKQSVDYPKLSQQERNALLEMYKLFDELSEERDELLPKLRAIDPNRPIAMAVTNRPRRSTVEVNLKAMRWNTPADVEYTTERAGAYGKKGTPNVWLLNWDKSPYKLFLNDKSKYSSLLDIINKANKDKDQFLKSRRVLGLGGLLIGPGGVKSAMSGQGEYESKVSNAKADFANTVALQMLSWMGQHNKRGRA